MKTSITTAIAIVAALMFCALFAPTAAAVSPTANAPTWNDGDSWAMGKSIDLDTEFSEQLDDIQQMLENMTGSASLDEFQVQASASAWSIVEVTEATVSEYVVESRFAARFNAEANIQVTGNMPVAGTRAWGDMYYPNASMTISLDATIDMAYVSEITVVFEKATMAIKSIDTTNSASAIASFDLINMPEQKFNWSDMSTTYSYKNINFDLDLSIVLDLGVEFSPYLNVIEFPLTYGSNWTVSSLATVTGGLSGHLDINGLSSSEEEMLFDNEMLQNAGITDFPIDFSKLSTEGDPKITNGTLEPITQYVNATMECTGVDLVTLPVYNEVDVFEVTVNDGEGKFYYSDDVSFLTSATASMDGLDLPDELDEISMPEADLDMEPVATETAELNIAAISSYQTDLSGSGNDDGIGGLILDNILIIGLIAAVVLVAAIIAVVVVKRKK